MQAGLQFFDMPLKGLGMGETQKIGIKMPAHLSDKTMFDEGGFSEIMDALMDLTPEQLQASLHQLEWVPVEGATELFAPVIDMSSLNQNSLELSQVLPEGIRSATPLVPKDHSLNLLNQTVTPNEMPSQTQLLEGGAKTPAAALSQTGATEVTLQSNTSPIPLVKEVLYGSDQAPVPKAGMIAAEEPKGVAPPYPAPELKKAEAPTVRGTVPPESVVAGPGKETMDKTGVETHQSWQERKLTTPKNSPPQAPQTLQAPQGLQNKVSNQEESQKLTGARLGAMEEVKQNQAAAARQFQVASDVGPNSNDKIINAAHQINETPVKEMARQTVQSAPANEFLEQAAEKATKVQPNTSVKDAALSFTSRWTAMPNTDNNIDAVAESRGAGAGSGLDRSESNDVIRQIVDRMTLKTGRLQSQMNIKLKPEFLGNVRLQITTDNQQVAVRIMAESSAVKEVIEQNMQFLRAELQQHGLEIDKFDVLVGKESDESRQGQQHAHWQRRTPHKERAPGEDDSGNYRSKESDAEDSKQNDGTLSREGEIDYFA